MRMRLLLLEDLERESEREMTVHDVLVRSARELKKQIEAHQELLVRAGGGVGGEVGAKLCSLFDCPHRKALRETLVETINVLEGTRRAFKSKQLEALRKRLIRVLAECG